MRIKEESRDLVMKVEKMKHVMMEYDLESIEQQTHEKVIYHYSIISI